MKLTDLIIECKKHEFLLTVMTFIDLICIAASYFAVFFEFILLPVDCLESAIFTPLLILIPEFIILFLLISIQIIIRHELITVKETD